jgi:hypothetical protein
MGTQNVVEPQTYQGERYPSGKLKVHRKPKPPDQPHRKGFGSNPIAETVHGRYYLGNHINGPQYVAGSLFLRARLRYRAAFGSPSGLRSRSEGHVVKIDHDDAKDVEAYEAARQLLGHLTADVELVLCQDAQLADLTAYRQGLNLLRRLHHV